MGRGKPAGRVRHLNPHIAQYDLAHERETKPDPEPTVLEAALARWADAPETEALHALRSLADRVEVLELRAGELTSEQAAAVLAGDAEAEDAALQEVAKVERMIAARLEAVPLLEERIRTETLEALEAKRSALEAELETAKADFDEVRASWREAVKLEAERRDAAAVAHGSMGRIKDELRQLGKRIDNV